MENGARITVLQVDNRAVSHEMDSKDLRFPTNEDNRSLVCDLNGGLSHVRPYWALTSLVNRSKCLEAGWKYERIVCDTYDRGPTWNKVAALLRWLGNDHSDIVVFLDSDAWIRDTQGISSLIDDFNKGPTFLLFGEEPNLPYNTKINTGCIITKNIPRAAEFWHAVWEYPNTNREFKEYLYKWPNEQKVTDALLSRSYQDFVTILPCDLINTPCGKFVRHCWWKNDIPELIFDEVMSMLATNLNSHSTT